MSLFAASTATASRHLRRHLLPNVNLRIGGGNVSTAATARQLSSNGAKEGGLRRTQTKGRHASGKSQASSSSSSSTPKSTVKQQEQGNYEGNDPHAIANEMVNSASGGLSAEGRISGIESVATLTREQKTSNFAMAAGLLGFVSYIFYYSLASVGGAESAKALIFGTNKKDEDGDATAPGFDEFLKEANEGRTIEEQREKAESDARGEARELAEMESSTAARLKAQGVGEEVIVAGSANEEEEREMARVAGFEDGAAAENGTKKRPMWKRVVFFWKRE